VSPAPSAVAGPELRDIHLPPPPHWWPPAPGWWLLAIVLGALAAWLFVYLYKRVRRRRERRAVMAELEREIAAARRDPQALAAALSRFLRRLARRATPGSGALAGEAWLEHLDRCAASDEFTRGAGRALIEAPFRPAAAYDAAALTALVRRSARRMLEAAPNHA
jgi:hypothetical protein